MWKAYSAGYMKQNRAICASVRAAALIAALFLSFLCGLFYNFWRDNIANVTEEEGPWHGRIIGEIDEQEISMIRSLEHVESVTVKEGAAGEDGTVVDIIFNPVRSIVKDMPLITEMLGLEEGEASYHYQLLSLYFVRIPGDEYPRLVMPFYLAIIVLVCIAMLLVIYNAFAFTMHARVHQFGIFASVGATPAQIRICLLQEAFRMTILPILMGILIGVALCRGVLAVIVKMAEQIVGGRSVKFMYPPYLLGLTFVLSAATVLMAAWMPAKKMSRMTPLEAIRESEEIQISSKVNFLEITFAGFAPRKRHSPIMFSLFGIEGELAGNFLKAQKRAFRTATLSLTLSFLGFMLVQCFFTLSDISTEETYFARYQDVWDIMVTVQDTGIAQVRLNDVEALRKLTGVEDIAVYQKAEAVCNVPEDWVSRELMTLGGLEALTDGSVISAQGIYTVKAPIVVLDNESFRQYYEQLGTDNKTDWLRGEGGTESLEGTVVINRVWDSLHSNFRDSQYIPFVQENQDKITLGGADSDKGLTEVPILAYAEKTPLLREEYADFALIQIMPQSYWGKIKAQTGGAERDTYIRILAKEDSSIEQLAELEKKVGQILARSYDTESENRLQEKVRNDEMIAGYKYILGGFCVLLAIIGIANVFSNTLGFLRIRRREVARYLSVGLTPGGVGKVFALEAVVIASRPVVITLPIIIVLVGMMIKASYLNPMVFIRRAPVGQMLLFMGAIYVSVAAAYYLGGKKVLGCNISETLREEIV